MLLRCGDTPLDELGRERRAARLVQRAELALGVEEHREAARGKRLLLGTRVLRSGPGPRSELRSGSELKSRPLRGGWWGESGVELGGHAGGRAAHQQEMIREQSKAKREDGATRRPPHRRRPRRPPLPLAPSHRPRASRTRRAAVARRAVHASSPAAPRRSGCRRARARRGRSGTTIRHGPPRCTAPAGPAGRRWPRAGAALAVDPAPCSASQRCRAGRTTRRRTRRRRPRGRR
eukprot:scaffold100588_cov60-Phaeocystis_antarctica.AAC.2